MTAARPVRVAIIGGGCASMAAAFELTKPEHLGRYSVTVYQQGWRLGGKGASGRGLGGRVEEHGLHVWLGFYENAFRLMRQAYAELGRDPKSCPIAHWRDAFFPDPQVGVTDRAPDGSWLRWLATFPPVEGEPGDPLDTRSNPFTVPAYLLRSLRLVRTLLFAVERRERGERAGPGARPDAEDSPAANAVYDSISRVLRAAPLASIAAVSHGVQLLELALSASTGREEGPMLRLLDAIDAGARRVIEDLVRHDDEMRRLWEIVDLVLAITRGCLRHGLLTDPRGLDAIDGWDCREWLVLNGASNRSADSAVVRGLYDLALAYEEGDPTRPRLAAGQAIRGAFRMFFTYRGSLFWKMRAGMGDVVFAPIYEVLSRRGARFEFFHRLENVRLSEPDGDRKRHVAALEMDVQARVAGEGEYRPLVDVQGLPCWPSRPDWSQLDDGERLRAEGRAFESWWDARSEDRKVLRVGQDFDAVVLGVGGGAVPHLCSELAEANPRWRSMVDNLHTVASQAFQVWLREDVEDLGWAHGSVNLAGFAKPFDTWADMSHLIPSESGPPEVRAIAYFCGALPCGSAPPPRGETAHPGEQRERVRRHAVEHLSANMRHLWPRAVDASGAFRWDLLVAPPGAPDAAGERRFDVQFWTANVSPTDRYVLALPGTIEHRISPLERTFDNFTACGDWTDNGFSEGCVESAVMGGLLAAHAISGLPRLEDVVGYDHP